MSLATIIERCDNREATEGIESPSVDLIYMVQGTEDDAAVRTLGEATIPALYAGLVFQTYHIAHQGSGVWEVSARYGNCRAHAGQAEGMKKNCEPLCGSSQLLNENRHPTFGAGLLACQFIFADDGSPSRSRDLWL